MHTIVEMNSCLLQLILWVFYILYITRVLVSNCVNNVDYETLDELEDDLEEVIKALASSSR
jgi:hypothetical protein